MCILHEKATPLQCVAFVSCDMPIVTVIMCDSWVLPNVIIFRKRAVLVLRPSLFGVLQKELCDLDIKEDNSQDKCSRFF